MKILTSTFFVILFISIGSCKKDFGTVVSSGNLTFSKDTIFLDTIFSNISSSTYSLKVYNKSNTAITIPSIRLGKDEASMYRLNVDGLAGKSFKDIDILAHDSIYVFVEASIDASSIKDPLYTDEITFQSQSKNQHVQLVSIVKDAHFLFPKKDSEGMNETIKIGVDDNDNPIEVNGFYLSDNTTWGNDKPYVVYGYVAVPKDKTLTISAGAEIYFHKNSGIIVEKGATLNINGTLNDHVILQGDRLEKYFEQLPGQWGTIWLRAGSKNNEIANTIIKNNEIGILVDSTTSSSNPTLKLTNTQIYNTTGFGLLGRNTFINGENLVIGNNGKASLGCIEGGKYNFIHTTIGNYSSTVFNQYASVYINNYSTSGETTIPKDLTEANFTNCIIYGDQSIELSLDKNEGAIFNYKLKNILLKFDDYSGDFNDNPLYDFNNTQHFQNIIINKIPDFEDVKLNKYNIGDKSAAINKGNVQEAQQVPLDILGVNRTSKPDLGAYQHKK